VRTHYRPDTGDVVVGRIVSVEQSRWLVDINSY
jgi:exosome complex RNA-binding protein Rrp4